MNILRPSAQLTKFIIIGLSNTVVDFFILNLLVLIFGLNNNDPRYTFFKIISFGAALLNSFIWNSLWVFKNESAQNESKTTEVIHFTAVSLVSFCINISVATLVYHFAHTILPFSSQIIFANIGAMFGSGVSLISNFLGYKHIVFKRKS